jgi:hypothetical protein
MRYAIVIWFVAAFALWDTRQNNAAYTGPIAYVLHRVVGGH